MSWLRILPTMSESGGQRSRRVERSAITALLPVVVIVPVWLIAMVILWLPFLFVAGIPFWIVPVVWLALAGLLFVPQVQVALLGRFLGTRPPSDDELAVIAPIWRDLAAKANLPQYRYVVRVIDSDELNAFACGGHLVVVTSFAIEELTRRELSGVLAHELSHHLGLHTAALTLGHWLSLPVLVLARFGFFLQNVARAATDAFVSHSAALTALGRLLAAVLTAVSWVFLAALYASDALANAGRPGRRVRGRSAGRADGIRQAARRRLAPGDPARRRGASSRVEGTPRRLAPAGPHSRRPHRSDAAPSLSIGPRSPPAARSASSSVSGGADVGDRRVEHADQVARGDADVEAALAAADVDDVEHERDLVEHRRATASSGRTG